MAVTVRIPTTLRPLSGGASSVSVEGSTLAEVLKNLDAAHPGERRRHRLDHPRRRRGLNAAAPPP